MSGKEWIALWELKQLWNKTTEELCNLVLSLDLPAYTHDKRLILPAALFAPPGRRMISKGVDLYPKEDRGTRFSKTDNPPVKSKKIPIDQLEPYVKYFQHDDVMNYALDHSLSLPQQQHGASRGYVKDEATSEVEPMEDITRKSASAQRHGSVGGSQPKIKEVAIKALIKYMKNDGKKFSDYPNSAIINKFFKHYKNKKIEIEHQSADWEASCTDEKIFFTCTEATRGEKPKKQEFSLAMSTLRKYYITLAKKRLDDERDEP